MGRGDPVLSDPLSRSPSALIFNPQTVEFQSKLRPSASPAHPELGQNIKPGGVSLLTLIQQHCSLPSSKCSEFSLKPYTKASFNSNDP